MSPAAIAPRTALNTQQILESVVHIARLRRVNTRAVLVDLLRARQPIAYPAFTPPP
ncbi:MAG TPA: hypothetical protein VKE96_30125 [Vicinamibacterales bacterium]|nr:hypothetical protein [Vicinamibacterales bacterium]